MPYGEFSLAEVKTKFGLTTAEWPDLFAGVPEVAPSPRLRSILDEFLPLALAINTEKAKSELLIAPLVLEVWSRLTGRMSLFSGVEFPVEPEVGLTGRCDFILSRSPEQEFITAPVMVIVEAKNDNPKDGFGQCAAGMVAARRFNDQKGTEVEVVYGAVSSGTLWRFLRLAADKTLTIDRWEYHLSQAPKLLGILHHIMAGPAAPAAAA